MSDFQRRYQDLKVNPLFSREKTFAFSTCQQFISCWSHQYSPTNQTISFLSPSWWTKHIVMLKCVAPKMDRCKKLGFSLVQVLLQLRQIWVRLENMTNCWRTLQGSKVINHQVLSSQVKGDYVADLASWETVRYWFSILSCHALLLHFTKHLSRMDSKTTWYLSIIYLAYELNFVKDYELQAFVQKWS